MAVSKLVASLEGRLDVIFPTEPIAKDCMGVTMPPSN